MKTKRSRFLINKKLFVKTFLGFLFNPHVRALIFTYEIYTVVAPSASEMGARVT